MRLTVPTDFEILRALSDGKRNNAINLAADIDRNRSYINTRLPILADFGLIDRVGPAPNSGLYVITERGRVVAEHQEAYENKEVEFEALIEDELADESGT